MTQDKNLQDDLDWFDGLIGKTEAGRGALLRRELDEIERTEAESQDLAHDWQRLQFAMRREKSHVKWGFFAMAASILIVFSALSMFKPINDSPIDEMVMRGMAEQVIVSADVAHDAKQLQTELNQLGVKVFRHDFAAGKVVLQIQLTYPVHDEVRAALELHSIPVPDEGNLTVSFIQSAQ